jgi:hypothetical protein
MEIKGKGAMSTYWLDPPESPKERRINMLDSIISGVEVGRDGLRSARSSLNQNNGAGAAAAPAAAAAAAAPAAAAGTAACATNAGGTPAEGML